MSEDEIKPVDRYKAIKRNGSFVFIEDDAGVWVYASDHQSAIDRLTAEMDRMRIIKSQDSDHVSFCHAEIDRLTAERDDWRRQAWHETDVAAVAVQEVERLKAERDAAESQRNGYMEQHCRDSAELRAVCSERDEAQRKLSVAVASGNALVAAAAEVCAWVKSGNCVPVDIDYVFREQAQKIADDIRRLDAARSEGGV